MSSLTKSRPFQAAVGVVTIVLLIRWMLTGELLMVAQAAQPPAEGNVSSVSLTAVVIPMLIDALALIGAAVIAGWLRLWSVLTALVDQIANHQQSPATEPTVQARPATGGDLAIELARAVAVDDRESIDRLQREIRRPYLVNEISRNAASGDLAAAEKLLAELRVLDGGSQPQAKVASRGKQ